MITGIARPVIASVAILAIVTVLIGLTSVARADSQQAARAQYQRGVRSYNLGEFSVAASEFRAAYRLAPTPALLFNIAQAHRAARDYDAAERYYARYLELVPDAPEREYISARREEMRSARDRGGPTRRHAGRSKRIAGIAAGVTGVALLLTAAVYANEASDASDEISAVFENGLTWNDHYAARAEEGRRAQNIALTTAALGGALAVGGAIVYYLGWSDARRQTAVAVTPARHGVGVAVSWTF